MNDRRRWLQYCAFEQRSYPSAEHEISIRSEEFEPLTAFVTGQSWQGKQWQRSLSSPRKWNDSPSCRLPVWNFTTVTQHLTCPSRLIFWKHPIVKQHIATSQLPRVGLSAQHGADDFFDASSEFTASRLTVANQRGPVDTRDRWISRSRRSCGKNWH